MNKLVIIVLLLFPASAWWDPDWNFSKTVTSTDDASLITGWFTVDTESLINTNKTRHDCGDLRVTKDDSPVEYYMTGCDTTYTSVFFEVDYSRDTYELYYGNPSGTDQSSSGVFNFFDNFESYSTGSDGSTTWTTRAGSFQVKYLNNSQRFVVNTTAESIATSYSPSGNFSVFAELGPGDGNVGLVYSYVSSSEYYAAYLKGTEVWICNGSVHAKIGDFTSSGLNYMAVEVLSGVANVYVNGNLEGIGNYSSGSVGVYALPDGPSNSSIDQFAVFPSAGVSWSFGSERTRPQVVLQFVGSEEANMRTVVAYMDEGDNMLRIQLESEEEDELVDGNSAELSWGNVSFNSTGYSVDGNFVKIDSDDYNYTQGEYRFELRYVKTNINYKKWHIVQFFYNFPAVKHVVFLTANQTGTYPVDIYPWSSCASYVNNTGNHSCRSSAMHSSTGIFRFGGSSICGLHWADTGTFRVYDNFTVSSKGYRKEVFWHSFDGCDKFTEEVELFCGTDFSPCNATSVVPVKTLFYINDAPKPFTRIEYTSGFSCTLNGESFTELVDHTEINKGLNDLECSGVGNLTYFKLYSSHPYEATRFFDEKPETYEIEIYGPVTRGKLRICGIPLFDKVLPFKCSSNNLFFEGDFLNGTQDFYLFRTKEPWSYTQAQGGGEAQVKITKMEPPQPPLASAKELGKSAVPPTHDVISSRRLFYSNSTVVEVVITAWRSI